MDTREIRCFRLVYEECSINKAASQIFITPQGLSRIITKLENELQTNFSRVLRTEHFLPRVVIISISRVRNFFTI